MFYYCFIFVAEEGSPEISVVERSGKEFKAHAYKRRERVDTQREKELGYDEDTFEEIFVTNIVV